MLTLVSNERIPLTNAMRMVFEIDSIDNGIQSGRSRLRGSIAGPMYVRKTQCPAGWYCPGNGKKYVCPAGRFGGASQAWTNANCEGECSAGKTKFDYHYSCYPVINS